MSMTKAQRFMSLNFALCTKNHALLHQVFCVYGQTPKAVKQAVHWHIPILVRTVGSSSVELLQVISDPPQGSENLLMQVLHILTEGRTPSRDLIMTVKQLYEIKLNDAGILIPMLSSLSKEEDSKNAKSTQIKRALLMRTPVLPSWMKLSVELSLMRSPRMQMLLRKNQRPTYT